MPKSKAFRRFMLFALVVVLAILISSPVLASTTTQADVTFNNIMKFLARWVGRIGLVIAFIGAVMFGFGVKNDDGDGKSKGVKWVASGIIVYAVTLSLDLFGIT